MQASQSDSASSTSLPSEAPAPSRPSLVLEDWLAMGCMVGLVAITFSNVLVRYFTNQSFAWTEEISVSLMVVLTMTAASAAMARDRHIRLEILIARGSARRQRLLRILSLLATIIAFLMLGYLGGRLAYDDFQYDVTSPGIGVPQWIYTIWLPVFSFLIAGRALQRLRKDSQLS